MEVVQEKEFILSNNGEIRGRKNLVQEIANSSFSDHIVLPAVRKNVNNVKPYEKKANTFGNHQTNNDSSDYVKVDDNKFENQNFVPNRNKHYFIDNAKFTHKESGRESFGPNLKPKSFYFSSVVPAKDEKSETFTNAHKNVKYFPRPNLETSNNHDSVDLANVYRNNLPEQESTDFGYLNYITQMRESKENKRDIEKSQKQHKFYFYNNDSPESYKKSHGESNQKNIYYTMNEQKNERFERENLINDSKKMNILFSDNLMASKCELSRNSSVRSLIKMLPVGKFAKQKFHVVQDEEEFLGRPVINDLNGLPIPNLEITNEFDCVSESVSINISKMTKVEIVVNILVSKYIRKNQIDKPWTKKTIEIIRTISIDVDASGKKEKVEKLINDLIKNKNETFSVKSSIYRLKGEKIQLSGYSALKVFKTLMKIAESWKTDKNTNYNCIPIYLLAVLDDPNSPCFPYE